MRVLGLVLLATIAAACTSVKMVQRDGCWIKRTEKVFGRVQEEIGPCTRAQPAWVEDRFTRLVQECVAQADHRWQRRAMEAWSRGQPYPAPPQEDILRTCMQESRVELVGENGELKRRVADLSADREALRAGAEQERAHLRSSNDRIAEYLGTAAQRPPGTATATASATNDETMSYEHGTTFSTGASPGSGATPAPAPIQAVQPTPAKPTPGGTPSTTPAKATTPPGATPDTPPAAAARVRRTAVLRRAATPGCDVAAQPVRAAAPAADPGGP